MNEMENIGMELNDTADQQDAFLAGWDDSDTAETADQPITDAEGEAADEENHSEEAETGDDEAQEGEADTKAEQQEALKAQLELAAKFDLPVNIHLRDATDDFFKVLDSCRGLGLRGNLHAFSSSSEIAARIRRYGEWYVGIGGVLTFKNAGIARDIADIPLIAAKLAELKGISLEQAAQVTTCNAKRLFARINN